MLTERTQTQKEILLDAQQTLLMTIANGKKVDPWCHHVLGTLSIAIECWSPKKMGGDDGRIDQALEEEEGVDVADRDVHELQLHGGLREVIYQFHVLVILVKGYSLLMGEASHHTFLMA